MSAYPTSTLSRSLPANPAGFPLEEKLKIVITRAAGKLPGEAGRQLLALIEPKALAIMVGVVVVWAGSQFFGVGEVADVVLLVAGWVAFGGVAWQAGRCLVDFASLTTNARSDVDLDRAADNLSKAVVLLGIQTILSLILKKPDSVLKDQYFASPASADPIPISAFEKLPSNRSWGYEPGIKGASSMLAGEGRTSLLTGDIEYSLAGTLEDQQLAIAHEKVHQFLTPKLNILRGLRGFTRAQGYNRSYILRYLEEALAETFAQLRVRGINPSHALEGIKFPVSNGYVSIAKLQAEAKGLLFGPITVGGQIFNVWYAQQ